MPFYECNYFRSSTLTKVEKYIEPICENYPHELQYIIIPLAVRFNDIYFPVL